MAETGAADFTDLCVVTAIGIEFKIAADLLSAKTFDEAGRRGRLRSQIEESRMKICRGLFGARRITILQSEMGAIGFTERLANHLDENRYDALIVAGLAGGLDPKLRVGAAVVYDFCYDARAIDFTHQQRPEKIASIASDHKLSDILYDAICRRSYSSHRNRVFATGITVSRIITEANEKFSLHVNCGAVAVDLETFQAFDVCSRYDLPVAALRVISDEAGHNLPDFNRAYDADGRMNGLRMAGAMIARPIGALRVLLTIRRALQSLRANLVAVMSA